jgi:hypothetical protein
MNNDGEYVLKSNVGYKNLEPLETLIDKPNIYSNYFHKTIAHPKTIIGLTVEKDELYVLLAYNTTEKRTVEKIIKNKTLNEPLDQKNLINLKQNKDPQFDNYKTFDNKLNDKLNRGEVIKRSEAT